MLPFATWRKVFRLPWVRENSVAVHFLSDVFYLLIALFRSRRLQDFNRLQCVYFEMIDSFAQYGRAEAKGTVNALLHIPWFDAHQRDLYRLISAYNRIVPSLSERCGNPVSLAQQQEINRDVADFVMAFKALTHFDEKDEARVRMLIEHPEVMDEMLRRILSNLA